MTVQEMLVALLQNKGLRVYPLFAPLTRTFPCVVYQMISNRQLRTHSGVAMERPRMQLSCWATSYDDCMTTAQTVKAALDLNRTVFKLATREYEMHAVEVEKEPALYHIALDYFIWIQ